MYLLGCPYCNEELALIIPFLPASIVMGLAEYMTHNIDKHWEMVLDTKVAMVIGTDEAIQSNKEKWLEKNKNSERYE